jgi:hypothetical protein
MQKVVHSSLTAPGRMDVVERVLSNEPFFKERMGQPAQFERTNRRGIQKQYSELTVAVVLSLAQGGLDAARMRRDEIIAKAFQYCEKTGEQVAVAA